MRRPNPLAALLSRSRSRPLNEAIAVAALAHVGEPVHIDEIMHALDVLFRYIEMRRRDDRFQHDRAKVQA